MRTLVWLIIVAFGCTAAQAQKKNDTFSVFFDLNVAELNVGARNTIDSLFYVEKLKNGVGISIIGYADYLATDEYNLELSRNRAEHVRDYLVQSGIRANLIKLLLGKGEVRRRDTLRSERGVAEDRRVDIVMEYVKPRQDVVRTDMSITVKQSGDTDIVMRPSEKLIIPPSSDDPGFDIDQVPAGKTFILKNIYFPMGRHFPRETSYDELNMLLQAMKENPRLAIQVEGHVCCITNDIPDALDLDSRSLDLSVNRARFIYEWLKARGIASHRLKYIGFGKSRPIFPNEQTQEEAATNRRVEIRIMSR